MESPSSLPGIFCFVMPFASPASVKHASKLVDCLSPNARLLYLACDRRLNLSGEPTHIHHIPLRSLHYLMEVKPLFWSISLWLVELIAILFRASIAFLRVSRRVDVLICFLGAYYTPLLILAKCLHKKAVCFEPVGEMAATEHVYHSKPAGRLILTALRQLTRLNRFLSDLIIIESSELIITGQLEPYRHKVRIANLYIDLNQYTQKIPLESRERVVGFLGRLSAEKGLLSLLDAARAITSTGIELLIAGDGPLRKVVEDLLEEPENTHIKYVRWLEQAEVIQFMNCIRILVLPSIGEGLPNSILEAMACGTPVLTTPVGGLRELIVHRETGYFISDTTPQGLVQAIVSTISDPNLASVALKGKELVQRNYSLSASCHKWRMVMGELFPDLVHPVPPADSVHPVVS
jgi:glycosyltransferase involved in cell wall biosynthesis